MSSEATTTFTPGTVLEDKWIIIEHIGTGAMGEVYRAHQKNLNRDVAIKTFSAEVLAAIVEDPEERETAIGRFRREVQTMARVRHPNILTIYDYGETDAYGRHEGVKTAYIVMEYVPGNTLRFTLDEDGLEDEPERFAGWIRAYFLPVLDGVQVLHDHRIVHRDLKPENIFLDGSIPKIADFGLARSHTMKAVTTSLEMLGTLAYMSPEQCSDFKSADYATDIYALGKMLFEAIHGTLTEKVVPFTSVSLDEPATPFLAAVSRIIEKATAESPDGRYQSATALREDAVRALDILAAGTKHPAMPSGWRARLSLPAVLPAKRIGMALAVIILAAGGMWGYHLLSGRGPEGHLFESVYTEHSGLLQNRHVLEVEAATELEPTLIGKDGSQMVLTGTADAATNEPLFYLDESPVSNFLFVEFLNARRDSLTVSDDIVRYGDTIICYLDSGSDDQAIVYQHERFHLIDQETGTDPAVRVTFHGAHLYAASYGKTLPSERQWRFAYRFHAWPRSAIDSNPEARQQQTGEGSMMHGMTAPAAPEHPPGVLNGMGVRVREWVRLVRPEPAQDGEEPVAGVMDADRLAKNQPVLKRFPWEGFADVGFRTALPVELN